MSDNGLRPSQKIGLAMAALVGAVIVSNHHQSKPTPTTGNCDPNYSGACVPNVYPDDVDCAGGSGNGPYYVQGPVQVIGTDHYGLDRDGDGTACE